MRVLVTGGWGYVGAQVVAALHRHRAKVEICDTGWFLGAHIHPPTGPAPCDLRGLGPDDLVNFDVVIHLAAYSNDPLGALDPGQTEALNHHATLGLARSARQAGVQRFVFASTCSVYGASGQALLDEFSPAAPITPYAQAKRRAELGLLDLVRPGFDVAILRGATAYGFSDCPRGDLLLNEFCMLAALGRPLVLTSDGASWRPFMPVSLFAEALVTAALQPPRQNDGLPIWNIAPPAQQMTVAQAAIRAAAISGAPEPVFGAAMPADRRSYRVDGRRLASAWPQLAYRDDFDAQILASIAGFAALPGLAADLERQRFTRLAMLGKDTSAQRMQTMVSDVP